MLTYITIWPTVCNSVKSGHYCKCNGIPHNVRIKVPEADLMQYKLKFDAMYLKYISSFKQASNTNVYKTEVIIEWHVTKMNKRRCKKVLMEDMEDKKAKKVGRHCCQRSDRAADSSRMEVVWYQ